MATATKTKLKVNPLADRVVIRPLEEAEQMRGGLYIPDTAKEKPQQGEIVAVGLGAAVVFVGVAVLGPMIARPVSHVLGRPLGRFRGITGALARENAARSPKRTAASASALMVGVGLVGFITVFASSARASIENLVDGNVVNEVRVAPDVRDHALVARSRIVNPAASSARGESKIVALIPGCRRRYASAYPPGPPPMSSSRFAPSGSGASRAISSAANAAIATIRIQTSIERAGRSITYMSARVDQDDRLVATSLAAFSGPWKGFDFDDAPEDVDRVVGGPISGLVEEQHPGHGELEPHRGPSSSLIRSSSLSMREARSGVSSRVKTILGITLSVSRLRSTRRR